MKRSKLAVAAAVGLSSLMVGSALADLDIVISPGSGLSGNSAALAAFNRAAGQWEAVYTDPITVTINADLINMGGGGVIGSTSSVLLQDTYAAIRPNWMADAADEADDSIVSFLPTAFTATIPAGRTLTANLIGNKAAFKAMGYTGLDGTFGVSDGTINFNSQFTFDFDNSNGVTAGTMDFETVAAHEIGHLLGFTSTVDSVNSGQNPITPFLLDLFRFANNTAADPASTADFNTFARNLVPGIDTVTDDIGGTEWRMSTGLTNASFPGTDGRQASHWKADELTGLHIGIMDPTLDFQEVNTLTAADIRALDLIGYDFLVPEPASIGLIGLAGLFLFRRRTA